MSDGLYDLGAMARRRRQAVESMGEAGARNSKGDKDRLVQIVMSAFSNLSQADQQELLKEMRKAAKPAPTKTAGGK